MLHTLKGLSEARHKSLDNKDKKKIMDYTKTFREAKAYFDKY